MSPVVNHDLALMRRRPEEIRWMNFRPLHVSHAIYRLTRNARTACGRRVRLKIADFASDFVRCRACERIVAKLYGGSR